MDMEKINWMLGMTQNMMNIVEKNMHIEMMPELYGMTSAMMGNLNIMKISGMVSMDVVNIMEQMMRGMEQMMMKMDMNSNSDKEMMKNMMSYLVWMQMSAIMMKK
jgi:hypothetical protein